MSDGWQLDAINHRMIFKRGARIVATTEGTLVNFLPTVYTFAAQAFTFPDISKGYCYAWAWEVDYSSLASANAKTSDCQSYITALPQEYTHKTSLMAAPAGADIFLGKVNLHRTTAPANTWAGNTLAVLPVENKSIPFAGSVLMEAELDMARAMSVYIDEDPLSATYRDLVLEVQQSIGPAPGGYEYYGDGTGGHLFADSSGGEYVNGGVAGIPVWTSNVSPWVRHFSGTFGNTSSGALLTARISGASPCTTTDPTDYSSVYSADISGRFGRRS